MRLEAGSVRGCAVWRVHWPARTERHREGRLHVRDLEVVEHDRLRATMRKQSVSSDGVRTGRVRSRVLYWHKKQHTFRSPCCSAEPSSDVYFFACRMLRSASCEGAQMPLVFCRHRSLSDARTDTTMVRWRALSGELVVYAAPSPKFESAGCASVMAAVMASAAESWWAFFSERTDIGKVSGVGCRVSGAANSRRPIRFGDASLYCIREWQCAKCCRVILKIVMHTTIYTWSSSAPQARPAQPARAGKVRPPGPALQILLLFQLLLFLQTTRILALPTLIP